MLSLMIDRTNERSGKQFAQDPMLHSGAFDIVANTDFKSIDEYIASRPEAIQSLLERVREVIRKALPGAEEVISYQIPAYKLQGRVVLYFAGWQNHYSIYPATEPTVAAFKDELAPYELSKGTIRFPLSKRIPVRLIGRIAKFRAKEVAGREQARTAKRPKPRRADFDVD